MTLYTRGEQQKFVITVYNSLGQKMRKPKIEFDIGDLTVVEQQEDKSFKGLKAGRTTVRMKYLEKFTKAEITVKDGLPPFAQEDKVKEQIQQNEQAKAD